MLLCKRARSCSTKSTRLLFVNTFIPVLHRLLYLGKNQYCSTVESLLSGRTVESFLSGRLREFGVQAETS